MSVSVKVGSDSEDVRSSFIRSDDGLQTFPLFVVSEVSDPVGATGGWQGNVPLDRGVTLLVWAF